MIHDEFIGVRKASQRQINGAKVSADRRRGKKLNVHVTTGDKDYSGEEMAFLGAIERYKEDTGRKFPTWTEVLGVVREMGYVRPM